jgi:hypothetical protein
MWVTPLVLDFGPVGVGHSSEVQTVTIYNIGDDTLAGFAGGGVYPPFSGAQDCAGGVSPGDSCQYYFTFAPTTTGTFTTTSNSGTNAGRFSIELRGEGAGAGLHVNPLSLDFGSVLSGSTSSQQIVTIRNTGRSTLTNFAGGGVYPPFSGAQNCAGGVLPGDSCQYFFEFAPTDVGTFTTTSNSSTNAGSFSIFLQGRGRSLFFGTGQRVTPRSLDFGPVGVGMSGETLVVTITNQDPFSPITGFAGGGVYPPFGASQNCAPSLPPLESCQFFYTFSPTTTGVFTAFSNVSDSAGSFSIELRGEGAGAGLSVSPLVLDFGPVTPGDTSPVQTATISNTGRSTLTNFAGGGVYPPFHATQDCASGVAPGDSCQYYFTFSPTTTGPFSTTSNSGTNAGPFSILLLGGMRMPDLEMSFLPDQIAPGEASTLQYVIHNPNKALTLFLVGLENTFPTGLQVADPLLYSVSPECGSPTFDPTVGAGSISFSEGTVLGGDDCVINLNVTAADIGAYINTTDPVTSANGDGNAASAVLRVGGLVYLPLIWR